MNKCILDSSALLALFNSEKGKDMVEDLLPFSVMSTVNTAEVAAELNNKLNIKAADCSKMIHSLVKEIVPFDFDQSIVTGLLKKTTKSLGLSLGDRACITLGTALNLPVYTADKSWKKLEGVNCRIILIR